MKNFDSGDSILLLILSIVALSVVFDLISKYQHDQAVLAERRIFVEECFKKGGVAVHKGNDLYECFVINPKPEGEN